MFVYLFVMVNLRDANSKLGTACAALASQRWLTNTVSIFANSKIRGSPMQILKIFDRELDRTFQTFCSIVFCIGKITSNLVLRMTIGVYENS